ncbi:homoserine kinase [Coraliomargarita parva]|uniref:homoserine kinase n=1 Tax=Coraliomargarita parva TaxID=3014050 RepID=UPI0022B5B9D8|nr:homoserine kinase [Coraliomargarita parva]
MSIQSVIAQIPASTSNCGPGFDSLSIALSLYNFVRITPREDDRIEAMDTASAGAQKMVVEAAMGFAQSAGVEIGGFSYEIWGDVPQARGLGSSSTIRAGVVAGLNAHFARPLNNESLISLVAKLDNAPDNTCAAFSGGFCIARTDPDTFAYREHVRFALPDSLAFVAVSPDYEVLTEDSRQVLPESISFKDAVRSSNSLAFLVGILVSGDFDRLKDSVVDYLHEPYREPLNPFCHEAIEAGCHSGAYTGWLSGSGSTVICVSDRSHAMAVGEAMQSAYTANGVHSRVFRLTAENEGLKVKIDR